MIYIRTILFYLGEAFSVIPFFFIAIASLPLPPKTRSKMISGWAIFITWWLKVTCGLSHEIINEKGIPDIPCVYASNHQSTWETFVTQTFLPPLAWVLKKELFRIPFFGWGLWATRPIAINRKERATALEQVIAQGKQKIAEGRHVLIFPEGTRTNYGAVRPYKKGATMLARAANVNIVPIAHNAGKYWSKNSLLIKPGVIRCVIGPAISTDNKSDPEVTAEIQSWITAQDV